MAFFRQIRVYIVFFIICGHWSLWQNSKYSLQIKLVSLLSIALVIFDFLSVFILDKIYDFNSLSNIIANLWFTAIVNTNLIILFETIYQKKAQANLIRNLSLVDELFSAKSNAMQSYAKEKREIFSRYFALLAIIISVDLTILFYTYYEDIYFNLMYPGMYLNTMMRLRPIQILFFVYLIRNRLIMVNEELKNIQKAVISSKSNKTLSSNNNHLSEEQSINCQLLNLKQIYGALYDSCELCRMIFGCGLVAFTMQTFTEFTSNCYWGYVCLNEHNCLLTNLLVPNILLLGTLAFYCSSCYQNVIHYINNLMT